MKQKLKEVRRPIFVFIAIVLGLVTLDLITASRSQMITYNTPEADSYFYETGSDTADYPVQPDISAQASILRSDNSLLSDPVATDRELTPEQIEEMAYRVLELDVDEITGLTNLQRLISEKKAANGGDSCWVALKVNMVNVPGLRHALSDMTDIRLARAVLRYLAEETEATRISLLACGGYSGLENDIFEKSLFDDNPIRTWAVQYPGLPEGFTLQQMIEEIQAANQQKTLDMINLNYDELYENGMSYREMTSAERRATRLLYIPVPEGNNGIGGLPTEDLRQDGGYNPTKAIYSSDVLVNVPKMKTTYEVDINCVMKNYIGSVSRGIYGGYRGGMVGVDHINLWETVFNLFSLRPSDYVLVDALACLEGEGSHPWKFYTGYLRRNYLIASSDPIAAESVAAQSMGFHPGDIEMLRWARAKGLGYYEPNRIRILGDSLSSVTLPFKKPCYEGQTQWYEELSVEDEYYHGRGCTRWLLCGPFEGSDIASNPGGAYPAYLNPSEGDNLSGKTWTSYYSPGSIVDLKQAVGPVVENARIYAFSRIYSPTDQQGTLRAGATDGIKVWINGQLALDEPENLGYFQRKFEVSLSLKAGDNRILVLLNNTSGDFGFSLACIDDGSSTVRESLIPYLNANGGWTELSAEPRVFTEQDKKNFYGGQTLPGTFYHLAAGPSEGGSGSHADCDFNGDGRIDIADVISFLLLARDNPGDPRVDWNGDGSYAINDAIVLSLDIMHGTCPDAQVQLAGVTDEIQAVKMESLTQSDIEYIEETMVQMNLTPEQEAAFRLALYGEAGAARLPRVFSLSQNSPNPFNPATTISYTVPEGSSVNVSLKVYNIRGTLVRTLVDKVHESGSYNVFWDGTDESGRQVSSGVYFCRMKAGDFVQTRKMVLLK